MKIFIYINDEDSIFLLLFDQFILVSILTNLSILKNYLSKIKWFSLKLIVT